jgi:carboxyl-terminal processing protease
MADRDYQLRSALNLLKGIRILNPNKKDKAEGSDQ